MIARIVVMRTSCKLMLLFEILVRRSCRLEAIDWRISLGKGELFVTLDA